MAITCQSNEWLDGYFRWEERLLCPLSCRWRSDWHPCHPSLTIGGIRDRRFPFFTARTDQRHEWRFATGNASNVYWLDTRLATRCGQFRQMGETCGGDGGYRFVGSVNSPPSKSIKYTSRPPCDSITACWIRQHSDDLQALRFNETIEKPCPGGPSEKACW